MKVIDLSFNEINGGSIEVVVQKKISGIKPKLIVQKFLKKSLKFQKTSLTFSR